LEAVGDRPISDEGRYLSEMGKSYDDKLFWVGRVNPDLVVDFGCADGAILAKLVSARPGTRVVGYDIDAAMLEMARRNLGPSAALTAEWPEVASLVRSANRPLLMLSSVIHEVYSYGTPAEVERFWRDQVFGGMFRWVCIRDMIPESSVGEPDGFLEDVSVVRAAVDPAQLASFEARWGSIASDYKTFVHFLLKYKYVENWSREVDEDYLPLSLEGLRLRVPPSYRVEYELSYVYDYFHRQVMEDLGVEVKRTTHTKMILGRRGRQAFPT
jgi:hypothetical protein